MQASGGVSQAPPGLALPLPDHIDRFTAAGSRGGQARRRLHSRLAGPGGCRPIRQQLQPGNSLSGTQTEGQRREALEPAVVARLCLPTAVQVRAAVRNLVGAADRPPATRPGPLLAARWRRRLPASAAPSPPLPCRAGWRRPLWSSSCRASWCCWGRWAPARPAWCSASCGGSTLRTRWVAPRQLQQQAATWLSSLRASLQPRGLRPLAVTRGDACNCAAASPASATRGPHATCGLSADAPLWRRACWQRRSPPLAPPSSLRRCQRST